MDFVRAWSAVLFGSLVGIPLILIALLRGVYRKGLRFLCTGLRDRPIPPAALDPRWGQHRFAVANGLRFHYVEKGDASKPLLLCLHGFPQCWFAYRHVLSAFSSTHHVVAIDMRGYGESDKPGASWASSRSYAVRELVEDVAALVTALGHGKSRGVTLMAHDWGALVGWCAAARLQDDGQLAKLIIVNGPHPACYSHNAGWRQILRSHYFAVFQVPWLAEFLLSRGDGAAIRDALRGRYMGVRRRSGPMSLSEEDVEVFKHAFSKPGALTAALNYYRQLGDRTHVDFRKLAPTTSRPLRAPVLVLWGTDDGALGVELTRGTERYCVGGYELKLLEGCSHWVLEDHAEEALASIKAFLAR